MVVSQRVIASRIGAVILKEGENAVDAAVTSGYTLAVIRLRAGNIQWWRIHAHLPSANGTRAEAEQGEISHPHHT